MTTSCKRKLACTLPAIYLSCLLVLQPANAGPPSGFQDIKALDSTIQVEMRYASHWNFMGRPITGYRANRCYLSKKAAQALKSVQNDIKEKKLGLLIFDCYRPTQAVSEFVRWTKDPKDQLMKAVYYPDENKADLITRGYIADKSGHSRGSTVDLTLIKQGPTSRQPISWPVLRFMEEKVDCRKQANITSTSQLDMGTMFDCFSVQANTGARDISPIAQKNRQILIAAMGKRGFINYEKEWWHFTLKDEPFKDTYFDTPID